MRDFEPASTRVGNPRKLDGRVRAVEMVAVVYIVEGHGCRGEQGESSRVCASQGLGSSERIGEERCAAFDAVAYAMEDLEARRRLEVSMGRLRCCAIPRGSAVLTEDPYGSPSIGWCMRYCGC